MAKFPNRLTLTNNATDILNAIRNSATIDYQNYIPIATGTDDDVKRIGGYLMDNPSMLNGFLNTLIGRIGATYVYSMSVYKSPFERVKKGMLQLGETTQQIFVDLCDSYRFDGDKDTKVFKKHKPNVDEVFYTMNYQNMYPLTVTENELQTAFISSANFESFVTKIVNSMYNSADYDDYCITMYMIARNIVDGYTHAIGIDNTDTAEAYKNNTALMREISNDMIQPSRLYTRAGNYNRCEKDKQIIIIKNSYEAKNDIEVLASAYNLTKAEYLGNKIPVTSFVPDMERVKMCLEGYDWFREFTETEIATLESVVALHCDEDYFHCYDNLFKTTDVENARGLYRNYFLHVWRTYATSPFANCVSYVGGEPTVISITPSASGITMQKGGTYQLFTDVATAYGASKVVEYTTNSDDVEVSASGLITVATDTSINTADVTITSKFDKSKSVTVTLTIT